MLSYLKILPYLVISEWFSRLVRISQGACAISLRLVKIGWPRGATRPLSSAELMRCYWQQFDCSEVIDCQDCWLVMSVVVVSLTDVTTTTGGDGAHC